MVDSVIVHAPSWLS